MKISFSDLFCSHLTCCDWAIIKYLLTDWYSVIDTLMPLHESVTVTEDHCSRWPIRLFPRCCWHQNISPALVLGACTEMQPLFWHQQNLGNNVMCQPVLTHWPIISDEHRGALPGAVQLVGEADVAQSPLRRVQVGEGLHGVPQAHGTLLVCAAKMRFLFLASALG